MASSTCCALACQWKAPDATGRLLRRSTAHLRFQEWVAPGVFLELWRVGLERYDLRTEGLVWSWLSMDGAMTKSPLGSGAENTGPNSTDRGKGGVKRSLSPPTSPIGIPVGLAVDGANRHDMKAGAVRHGGQPARAATGAQSRPAPGYVPG